MTDLGPAWIGLGGVGVGAMIGGAVSFFTVRSSERLAKSRLEHERALARLQIEDAGRARLYADRIHAYNRFAAAHLERRRRDDAADLWWNRRQMLGREKPIDAEQFDEAQRTWGTEALAAGDARMRVEEAVAALMIVATAPVRDAAVDVLEAARTVSELANKRADEADESKTVDRWRSYTVALALLQQTELRLQDAIRTELGVDDVVSPGRVLLRDAAPPLEETD